jgi:hypothetical protein
VKFRFRLLGWATAPPPCARLSLLVLVLGIACLCPAEARAHDRSVSFATWTVDEKGAEVTLRIEERELTRLPEAAVAGQDGELAVGRVLAGSLLARRGGVACTVAGGPDRVASPKGRAAFRWRVACPANGMFEVESGLFAALGVPHLCFLRIAIAGSGSFEAVLHADRPGWSQPVSGEVSPAAVLTQSASLGIRHISSGLDHLFFVFGLVVVATALAEVAVVITAFTVAHTITLGAAALGLLRPAVVPVEALIAVSIGLLAVENLTLRVGTGPRHSRRPAAAAILVLVLPLGAAGMGIGRVPLLPLAGVVVFASCYLAFAERRPGDRRLRWLVAFVFGLLHGFGFAGSLIESGFSRETVAATLLGFNAGVEAAQLLFVASLWPLLGLARRRFGDGYGRAVVEPASVALLAGAAGWYGVRAFAH